MIILEKSFLISILLLTFLGCNDDKSITKSEDLALPTISINTEKSSPLFYLKKIYHHLKKDGVRLDIVPKNQYLDGTLKISSKIENENLIANIRIRGRGNSTWQFPKKPYQIKFDKKESVLGMPKDKKWILLANYSDKTMLRNEVAFDLSRFSNLHWTPESRFVELYINNEYLGIYQITQKIEETSNRLNIGNDGYLLVIEHPARLHPHNTFFKTKNYLFKIKEPNLDFGDKKYNLIKNYIELTENVLFNNNFKDPHEGYSKYIDVDSFVDWYLVNEITKNNDSKFVTSVFMNYVPGGKLKMGPIWDYDISLGNINYNGNETTEGFWIKNAIWFSRLFEDPNFVIKVKSRFNYFYNNRVLFQEHIKLNSLNLNQSQKKNFHKWPILGKYIWPNNVYFPTYDQEVIYLKEWLDKRLEWLYHNLNEL